MRDEQFTQAVELALMAVKHNEQINERSEAVERDCYALMDAAKRTIDLGQCYGVPVALTELNFHLEAARNLRKAIDIHLAKRGIARTPPEITQEFVREVQERMGEQLTVERTLGKMRAASGGN